MSVRSQAALDFPRRYLVYMSYARVRARAGQRGKGSMSNEPYKAQEIEQKWRRRWEERGMHRVADADPRPKYYCLDMFPYPSGSGLHVGHWRGYVLSDVWSRYKTLQGYKVLHPMGWDAFGLPAENDAIKKGINLKVNTERNIANIKEQLEYIGAIYDWS